MPKDTLDIIDTAVKIGLGALISGVTAYFVTNRNNAHEKSQFALNKKTSILEDASGDINLYIHQLEKLYSRYDAMYKNGHTGGKITKQERETYKLIELDNELIETRAKVSVAISRLYMIDLQDLIKSTSLLKVFEKTLRNQVIFDNSLPTIDEMKNITAEFIKLRNIYYISLKSAFKQMYC